MSWCKARWVDSKNFPSLTSSFISIDLLGPCGQLRSTMPGFLWKFVSKYKQMDVKVSKSERLKEISNLCHINRKNRWVGVNCKKGQSNSFAYSIEFAIFPSLRLGSRTGSEAVGQEVMGGQKHLKNKTYQQFCNFWNSWIGNFTNNSGHWKKFSHFIWSVEYVKLGL